MTVSIGGDFHARQQTATCLDTSDGEIKSAVRWKGVAADLKAVSRAATAAEADQQLVASAAKWDDPYPSSAKT